MASVEDDQSLYDSVLLSLNYRDLQKVAKRFKIPANLKKDKMLMLIQSRRDGKEKTIDEFFSERNELKAKRQAEKQEIMLKGPQNLNKIQPKKGRGRGRGRGGLQWSLNQVHKNLQMTSYHRPMFSNMQRMPRLQRPVVPNHQYQQENITPHCYSSFRHHFNLQHPSLNISDVHGNSYEHDLNVGQREQYYNQQNTNDFWKVKNIRSSSPDGEIDVGVGEDYNLDCVSSSGDIGNDIKQETDDTIQMNQEQSTDIPVFETQQKLARPAADMNVSYQQQSCMLSSTLYQQHTVMHTSQSAIIPQTINKLPIFCGNNRNNFVETTCQQNVINFPQLQPMISPAGSTPLSGFDSGIDSPVINVLDKQLEWQNTMNQPTSIDLNFEANKTGIPMLTKIEKKTSLDIANEIGLNKCQTSANYMEMVTCEVQPIVNINSNPPRTYMYSDTLQLSTHVNDQGMLRQRPSSRNSDTSSIPEPLIENIKEDLDNYTEEIKQEEGEEVEEMFPCTNSIRGCTKQLYNFQFDDHVKYCHYQIVYCFFGCGWINILKLFSNHLNQVHPWSIEKYAEKISIMKKEMFYKNPKFCYIQSYNERIFLITLEYFQGHLFTSMKFLPDENTKTSFGGIEILCDETVENQGIPFSPFRWSGVLEPYHQHSAPTNPDSHSLIININNLQDSFKFYTNVNKIPQPNDYASFNQFRMRNEFF